MMQAQHKEKKRSESNEKDDMDRTGGYASPKKKSTDKSYDIIPKPKKS